jgi:DNA-binding XRE family transcriptional regulator
LFPKAVIVGDEVAHAHIWVFPNNKVSGEAKNFEANLKILKELGEQIQLARLRRRFSAAQIAERTGMGRKTVYNIEQGSPSVAIGNYLQVLFVLGLEKDLTMIAASDPLGRKLQDAGIITGKRAPKQTKI